MWLLGSWPDASLLRITVRMVSASIRDLRCWLQRETARFTRVSTPDASTRGAKVQASTSILLLGLVSSADFLTPDLFVPDLEAPQVKMHGDCCAVTTLDAKLILRNGLAAGGADFAQSWPAPDVRH